MEALMEDKMSAKTHKTVNEQLEEQDHEMCCCCCKTSRGCSPAALRKRTT